MNCKICDSECREIFKAKLLFKYQVSYFQCTSCEFIQTEKPYWLEEAYQSAITKLDIGLVSRNIKFQKRVAAIIDSSFDKEGKFIDYGGGYGLFVRLMRDAGYDYYRQDYFCQNLFANDFDVTDLPEGTRFELLTAFEVFEHLEDPKGEIEKMLQLSDNIFFSTEVQPGPDLTPESWWYFFPETGQHIAFYSLKSLEFLAKRFDLNLCSAGTVHLLSKKKVAPAKFHSAISRTGLLIKTIREIFNKKKSVADVSRF